MSQNEEARHARRLRAYKIMADQQVRRIVETMVAYTEGGAAGSIETKDNIRAVGAPPGSEDDDKHSLTGS